MTVFMYKGCRMSFLQPFLVVFLGNIGRPLLKQFGSTDYVSLTYINETIHLV